jgi:hypothetical protein
MRSGLLFPRLVDLLVRTRIEQSLLNIKCFIPSIKSIHWNLTYLEEGAVLLKRLVAGDCKRGTLRSTLQMQWKNPRDCIVEILPGVYQVIKDISNET